MNLSQNNHLHERKKRFYKKIILSTVLKFYESYDFEKILPYTSMLSSQLFFPSVRKKGIFTKSQSKKQEIVV
jgi:hypothetical protein